MIGDYLYKLARKSLDPQLYRGFSNSVLGRGRTWGKVENYAGMFDYYRHGGVDFDGKIVVEVGSGNQFFTALFFLSAGAAKVILVDPKLTLEAEGLEGAAAAFAAERGAGPSPADARARIECHRDLSEVPAAWDGKAGFLGSYLVLEHFTDIRPFFRHARRLLAPDGLSRNKVDLSDHTYHILGKYPLTRVLAGRRSLYHLRYSDAAFRRVNDPKCYMNRKLLPEYLAAAHEFGFRILDLRKRVDGRAVVHRDLTSRFPGHESEDYRVIDFDLDLAKA